MQAIYKMGEGVHIVMHFQPTLWQDATKGYVLFYMRKDSEHIPCSIEFSWFLLKQNATFFAFMTSLEKISYLNPSHLMLVVVPILS